MEISEEELIRIEERIEKLKASKFKQQMLPAWRPVPSFGSTMIIFGVFGLLFLFLGITLYVMSEQVQGVMVRYDDACLTQTPIEILDPDNSGCSSADCSQAEIQAKKCELEFTVDAKIEAPVYVYYQLDNFYQNHRRYVKSRSNAQLLGEWLTVEDLEDSCTPILTNENVGRWKAYDGVTDLAMD